MMQQQASKGLTQSKTSALRSSTAEYGSDVVIELLRELGIPYIALNPGASYRGLHDSLVNFGAVQAPEIILCCHEEIAVAVAGGYARVTGKPLAVALHNVVGLQHGSMGIFCAYCDRAPMIILGGTGPMDTSKRRPHIDWVHTALVQGNQVRDYVKWDDQPASVAAVPESVLRAYRIATTEPQGPVYLCFDTELQEEPVTAPVMLPDVTRFAAPVPPAANPKALREAAALLAQAQWPVIMAGAVGRHHEAVPLLQELAELLGCAVVDQGDYFNFPSTHPLDLTLDRQAAVAGTDVLLGLDVFDLGGASSGIKDRATLTSTLHTDASVIHITLGDLLQSKWAGDYERMHPVDLPIAADTAEALPELIALCKTELAADASSSGRVAARRQKVEELHNAARERARAQVSREWDLQPISAVRLYSELWSLIEGTKWSLAGAAGRVALRSLWDITEPDQRSDVGRGGGVGYQTGASLGAALAYKDTDRLCISIVGDGDLLMASSALWTAANAQLPVLYIVFNNRSYYNDEGHQEYLARTRNRPVENKGVGIVLTGPEANFAALASSLGVEGFGPVTDAASLHSTLEQAIRVVRDERRPALVDVLTQPR